MSDFDRWRHWGRDLTHNEFASAWAALGTVAASESARRFLQQYEKMLRQSPDAAPLVAQQAVASALMEEPGGGPAASVLWSYPVFGSLEPFTTLLPPSHWAAAWPRAVNAVHLVAPTEGAAGPRLRIITPAPRPSSMAWLELLSHAEPKAAAVSLRIEPPNAQLFVTWPLRLGWLGGNEAARFIHLARTGIFRDLTRTVAVGRQDTNSDVLVHLGSGDDLLATLGDLHVRPKTNLLVLLDPALERRSDLRHKLMEATHASGLIVAGPNDPGGALRSLVAGLCHNLPFDVASTAASTVAWLSDPLADLRLEGVARAITRRAAPRLRPHFPVLDVEGLTWERELEGARAVAAATVAIEAAIDDAVAAQEPEARFLQQQSFVLTDTGKVQAAGGFIAGQPAEVVVRIGLPDAQWNALDVPLDERKLPPDFDECALTVWLTEARHLKKPVPKSLVLRRFGNSTEATFSFTPKSTRDFEGRLTVLHRGRVIQTALLLAAVRRAGEPADSDGTPILADALRVRHRLSDLDARRPFDFSFVINRTPSGKAQIYAASDRDAWVTDASLADEVMKEINRALSGIAASVGTYKKGIGGAAGRALLIHLARAGEVLFTSLVTNQLRKTGLRDGAEYLQVVSTKPDGVVPLEFIYDHVSPDDTARVCQRWRTAVAKGGHRCTCDPTDPRIVCPLGFWGLSKVIERQADEPQRSGNAVAYVRTEPGRTRKALQLGKPAMVACSKNVTPRELKPLLTRLEACLDDKPRRPRNWKEWAKTVARDKPRILIALPHTQNRGINSELEINKECIRATAITAEHIYSPPPDSPPLVALIGCDTTGSADDYGIHVMKFRAGGAAVLIATVATVFGGHAPAAAALLVDQLLPASTAKPPRLGEAMRAMKQQALLKGMLMPLCLVAYGDADWELTR